jgi:hypothetical protein
MVRHLKSNTILYLILIIFSFFNIIKNLNFPVYIDEATTYIDYTSKGLWISLSKYYEPNNHVFFSLIVALFQKLPIDPLIAMRIPNILLGILTISILYHYLKTKYSIWTTMICTVFFSFSYTVLFYSIFARGYLTIIACTLITFILLEKIEKIEKNKYFLLLGITTIIGFFTIPIYLYVTLTFVSIILLRFKKNIQLLKRFFWTYLVSGSFIILLYLPIILTNGLDALIKNKYNTQKTSNEIFEFLTNGWVGFYDKIWGVQTGLLMFFLIISTIILLIKYRSERRVAIEFLIAITLPFLFVILHKVIPGFRTWTYIIIPMIFLIASLTEICINMLSINLKYPVTIIICSFSILTQLYIFNKSHPIAGHPNDVQANKIANYLVKTFPTSKINFEDGRKDYDAVIYLFEHKRMHLNNKVSFKLIPQKEINVVSINKFKKSSNHRVLQKFSNKIVYTTTFYWQE